MSIDIVSEWSKFTLLFTIGLEVLETWSLTGSAKGDRAAINLCHIGPPPSDPENCRQKR